MTNKINELESCFNKEHKVILLTGGMASGKTMLINKFLENKNSFIFNTYDFQGDFICELASYFAEKFIEVYPDAVFNETSFNLNRYFEIINHYKESNPELHTKILNHNLIQNNFDYFVNETVDISKYKDSFINKADQKLVWEQGKIVVESLLVDVINFLYPNFNFEDISKSTKSKQLIFVFDEVDHILNFIDNNFISYLIEHLDTNLNKFENYDFTKDKDLKLTDIIDIRIIVSSRNKSFEKYQSKIELESQLYPNDDFIFEDIPFIKEFKEQNKHTDFNEFQYAEELFFKYSSNYERQFLTVAIFLSKFTTSSFAIFPELKLTDKIINNYMSNFYFISIENNIFQINSEKNRYITYINENTNPEIYKELTGRAKLNEFIISFLNKVPIEDFNIFRKLAYFNYFDTNNALSNIFPDLNKKFIVLIDKYKNLLNKNNFHLSLKKEYESQIDKYNKLVDDKNYVMIKKRVKELWMTTKQTLYDKKSEFDKNIKSTKESIKNYQKDSDNFNKKLENISNLIFNEENILSGLDKTLKPYKHKRPVIQTLSIALMSLVLFVISFFDNFILNIYDSEVFLNIINWLFRIISILGFVFTSKSLYRIYIRNRDKDKRIELEKKISQVKIKIKDQQEVRAVINADIKATEAKIQELELDTQNYSKEIEEIELKLNEPFI